MMRWKIPSVAAQTQGSKTGKSLGVGHSEVLMEVVSLFIYLNCQLAQEHRYPLLPNFKRADVFDQLAHGLEHFTFGQMVCLCWRAVDRASSWKERKGLTGAHAALAVATVLGGKIADALENTSSPPPERKPSRHPPEPPGLAAARDLLRYPEVLREQQEGCQLHDRHRLPCVLCLGMLYGGGEEAEKTRAHFASLGCSGIVFRPDLSTKAEIRGTVNL